MQLPSRRLRLSEADQAAWAVFARAVAPLAGRRNPESPRSEPAPAGAVAPAIPAPPVAPAVAPAPVRAAPLAVGQNPGDLDNASWNRLRGGKLQPARTLDLHGRTAQRAYLALHTFLVAAHTDRLRCVEIITGRGSGENGGVIRRELPLWLNLPALRPLVLAATHPHPANPGSVRLLLRRAR